MSAKFNTVPNKKRIEDALKFKGRLGARLPMEDSKGLFSPLVVRQSVG